MCRFVLIGIFALMFGTNNSTAIVFSRTNTITFFNSPVPPTPAPPYPSTNHVSGFPTNATITKVTVTLHNFTHSSPDDVDMMLVGPTGARFVFFTDCGGVAPVVNQTFTFDDAAASAMPDASALSTGTWRPASYGAAVDSFPEGPIPVAPGNFAATNGNGTFASNFNGTNPNGVWSLYVVDDLNNVSSGSISNGWSLNILATAPPVIQNVARSGTNMTFEFVSQNGFGHVIEYKNSLSVTNWTTLQTIVGNGALKTVTITNILAPAERYYRIRMP